MQPNQGDKEVMLAYKVLPKMSSMIIKTAMNNRGRSLFDARSTVPCNVILDKKEAGVDFGG